MKEKTIRLPKIGKVVLKKSAKAHRIYIRLRPFEGVKVSVPTRVTYAEAEEVVWQKRDWIERNLAKMQSVEQGYTIFNEETDFHTREHRLVIKASNTPKTYSRISKDTIQVYYPAQVNVADESIQQAVRQAIERTWRKEAQAYLPKRLAELARKHKFSYKKVFIKNSKTRWGSCSSENNINLSLHLMRLPDTLIDYVLLHELCHTIHKHHGATFWELLDQVSGDARGLDKQVNQYHIKIY